jgi:hypothetical protein
MLVIAFTLAVMRLATGITDFSLSDQFEVKQNIYFQGKQTIVMIGDRTGLEQMPLWEQRLQAECTKANLPMPQIVRVAYFKGMPFFVPRSAARNSVQQTYPKASVICDWDGTVGEQYGYNDGLGLYFISPTVQIRARANGEFSQSRMDAFVQSIMQSTKQNGQ